ncbi:MAG TPA: CDP-alcohol phosphatidyltransferase family protein [Candidatus Binataceae bacterium]|nr:CDP-alcohol phosphatidyltransferase family protein [Candidatus Binataceae bacterium]
MSEIVARPSLQPVQPATQPKAQPSLSQLLKTPNLLTLCRLFMIPVFLALLSKHRFNYALYLFILAAITDSLDGTVARWSGTRTELGAFLDPFADKLLLLSSFVVLTIEQIFPGWILSVIVVRDVVIVFGYFMISFLTGARMPVRPSYIGKSCTALQLACIIAALIHFEAYSTLYWYGLLYATVGVTALSGIHYVYCGLRWLSTREPQIFS